MRLPRLSLPILASTVLLPAVAFAAPAQSASELFARLTTSEETRQFNVETSLTDPSSGTTTVSVRGKMRGQGAEAIAHGIVEVKNGADTMRLRMAIIDDTVYLKLSNAGDSTDLMAVDEGLGVEPWLALPLDSQAVTDELPMSLPGFDLADLSSPSTASDDLINSLFSITSAVSDGQGGTVYTIELARRPVLALAQALNGMFLFGEDVDLEHDLEIRRLDGWVRDAVSFLAHVSETASGGLGSSDLALNVSADDEMSMSLTLQTSPVSEPFTLVKPLLTISLEDLMADEAIGPTSWSFLAPVHGDDWDYGVDDAGCSLSDARRGLCGDLYQSRRSLGQ